ncbi:MAG TPA: hypothetical protein ENN81_04680, partial [Phycisphaerales bacterium]|nr:hypothetical protein [Phycisphaerales bacterium]
MDSRGDGGNIAASDFTQSDLEYTFNYDEKIQKASWDGGSQYVSFMYDPMGNRTIKKSVIGSPNPTTTQRKYI